MRAVIPVAGIGTRLRPHTYTLPKVLVNVAGKPILGHILDAIIRQGITSATIITGYKGELVEEYIRSEYDLPCDFVAQGEMKGLGHAIWTARHTFTSDPIMIILGDTVFDVDLTVLHSSQHSSLGVKNVEDPRPFGVVVSEGNFVTRLVEKPETPISNNALVGIYYINHTDLLRQCLQELIDKDIRTKGEYQLTDALQLMVDGGEKFTTFTVDGWYDCGKPETLLETNRFLLTSRSFVNGQESIVNEQMVKLSNGHMMKGVVVVPPVHIDPTAVVENSVIGPYASLSKGAVVRNSIVRDSIICDQATVSDVTLDQSIIGENAFVSGRFASINIGDASIVKLSQ